MAPPMTDPISLLAVFLTAWFAVVLVMSCLVAVIGVATWGRRRCGQGKRLRCILRPGHPGRHKAIDAEMWWGDDEEGQETRPDG